MELLVKNPDGLTNIKEFCDRLIISMQEYAGNPSNYDKSLVKTWNDYFEATDLGWPIDETGTPVAPTFERIVDLWFSHLYTMEIKGDYCIVPDVELKLNYTGLTIDSLARMINFGVLGVAPYRFFDDTLDLYAEWVPDLYGEWMAPESSLEED